MNKSSRVISYIIILTIGFALGYYYSKHIYKINSFALELTVTNYLSAHRNMQLKEGTDILREEAIRSFLAINKIQMRNPRPWLTPKILATDAALANARLAALAKKRGASQEAEKYLELAASFCPEIGWRDCSAQKINTLVQQLDKDGVFGSSI